MAANPQQQHLIQVVLPNNHTILAVTVQALRPTANDVLQAVLCDDANTAQLQAVFGAHFDPIHKQLTSSDESKHWLKAANNTPWALQSVQVSDPNREWQQDELNSLDDGLLPLDSDILSFLRKDYYDPVKSSAFSDFALSAHLHAPRLRLVCGAPGLCLRLAFVHVPEIQDGWSNRLWFLPAPSDTDSPAAGTGSLASELIQAVIEELGIRKVVLQGSKSARVEYAIAMPASGKSITALPPPPPLPPSTALPHYLEAMTQDNTDQVPMLLFTVSATWFSRLGTVAMGFAKHAKKSSSIVDEDQPAASKQHGSPSSSPSPANKARPAPPAVLSLWSGNASPAGPSVVKPGITSGDPQLDAIAIDHIRTDSTDTEDSDADRGGTFKGRKGTSLDTHTYGSVKGTAAFMNAPAASTSSAVVAAASPVRRHNSQKPTHTATARLSKMFESWGAAADADQTPRTPSRTSPTVGRSGKRFSVSAPLELEPQNTGGSIGSPVSLTGPSPHRVSSPTLSAFNISLTDEDDDQSDLSEKFEQLMTDLGIKGASRTAMLALPDDRKRFLIAQNSKTGTAPTSPSSIAQRRPPLAPRSSTVDSPQTDNGSGLIDSVSRAAGGWTNRFSIASLTGWGGAQSHDEDHQAQASPDSTDVDTVTVNRDQIASPTSGPHRSLATLEDLPTTDSAHGQLKPMQTGASATGSIWSNWWGSSAAPAASPSINGPNGTSLAPPTNAITDKTSPHYYAANLASPKLSRKDLVKTLIALRVTLSSAKLKWIETFVSSEDQAAKGLEVLQSILAKETDALVLDRRTRGRGGSESSGRDELSDSVITECVKCLRGIMNTEVSIASARSASAMTYVDAFQSPHPPSSASTQF